MEASAVASHPGGELDRLRAELEISRRQLVEAQQLARIGSWEWDLATGAVTWSPELYRIYGLEPGAIEVSYEEFLARVHPDDRASVDERNRRCFETHGPFDDVKRVVRSDGAVFMMRTRGEMVCAADGTPLRMIGICEDVTEQRRAEIADALRHRAVELNDTVLQALVLAGYQLDLADPAKARELLDQALDNCRRIVDELLEPDADQLAGHLRRGSSPGVG